MTRSQGAQEFADRLGLWEASDATAVVLEDRVLTYAELDGLVDQRAGELGTTRRLIMLECANALDPLVTYLAALRGRHPVLLLPAGDDTPAGRQWQRIKATYQPDLICSRRGDRWVDDEVRAGTAHDLHPDLAVLLGTSGSTGTPKLVRLSRENLRSNAAVIAEYLGLDSTSRAATTLPMHYCYGLSVLNSHLEAGASLWLTEASVIDPGFWEGFGRAGATSFAGVPYTFDLLARSGEDWLAQPGLRLVTQAGGRLAPAQVRDLALRSRQQDVDFFVMYGQTEATARMAYLPPDLAAERPDCIGVPIDGGDFRIDDGELVYTGPNVMLGYAETPADLALGSTLTELRTGDLAVQHDDGLFEIVGRRSRIAKLYGVRLDLDLVERLLAESGIAGHVVTARERVHAFVREESVRDDACALLAAQHCLPPHSIVVHVVDDFPLTASGKPDRVALERIADRAPVAETPRDVRSAYAGVFGREIADQDSFLTLQGDSLSYVEVYTRLERILGTVPANWPTLSVAELSDRVRRPRRFWAALETPMVLRAAAITLLIGAHVDLWTTQGGAHVLLALFGYNLCRFGLVVAQPRARLVSVLRMVADLLAPALALVVVVIAFGGYGWPNLFMLNHVLGSTEDWDAGWQLWFLEAVSWTAVLLAGALSLPGVRTAHRRWPFGVAVVALGVAMLAREFAAPGSGPGYLYSPLASAWCILLGVVAANADSRLKKSIAILLAAACTLGYFSVPLRGYLVIGAVLLVVALPSVPVPRPLDRVLATIASASLFIYITHWQFYPQIEDSGHRLLALLVSLVVGILVWAAWTGARRTVSLRLREPKNRARPGGRHP